jgi:YVTN family beta-propeller protein
MLRCFTAVVIITVFAFGLITAEAAFAGQLLVVSRTEQKLAFYDVDSKKLLASAPTGIDPREVAVTPDGRTAFVSDFGDHKNTVSVFDVGSRSARPRIPIKKAWGPHGLAVSSDGKTLFVTCEKSRAIVLVDVATGRERRKFSNSMTGSHMLTLSPDDLWLFVVNTVDDNVTIYDAKNGALERHILVGDHPEGAAVTPDGKELWVTAQGSNAVTIVNLETRKKDGVIPCRGTPSRVGFTPDGARAVVTCASMGHVFVIDAADRSIVERIATGDTPYGLSIGGGYAWIANAGSSVVSQVDVDKLVVVGEMPVIDTPSGIVYVE